MRQVGFRDCSLVVCGFCAARRHIFSVPDCTKTWCHNWRYEYALLFRFFLWFEAWSCVWVFLLLCSWIYNMYLKVRWNWGGIENMNRRNVIYCLLFSVEKCYVLLPILCVQSWTQISENDLHMTYQWLWKWSSEKLKNRQVLQSLLKWYFNFSSWIKMNCNQDELSNYQMRQSWFHCFNLLLPGSLFFAFVQECNQGLQWKCKERTKVQ